MGAPYPTNKICQLTRFINNSLVWFLVTDVRLKPAHKISLERAKLGKNRSGQQHAYFEAAEKKAYVIDFEIRCKPENVKLVYTNNAKFVSLVRYKLCAFSSCCFRSSWQHLGGCPTPVHFGVVI